MLQTVLKMKALLLHDSNRQLLEFPYQELPTRWSHNALLLVHSRTSSTHEKGFLKLLFVAKLSLGAYDYTSKIYALNDQSRNTSVSVSLLLKGSEASQAEVAWVLVGAFLISSIEVASLKVVSRKRNYY